MNAGSWQKWFAEKPCRCGWKAFVSLLEGYEDESEVASSLEPVDDRLDRWSSWAAKFAIRPSLLSFIAHHTDDEVALYEVARNRRCPADILDILSYERDTDLLCIIACNENTSRRTLREMLWRILRRKSEWWYDRLLVELLTRVDPITADRARKFLGW